MRVGIVLFGLGTALVATASALAGSLLMAFSATLIAIALEERLPDAPSPPPGVTVPVSTAPQDRERSRA